jgi:hypothetical protein
VCGHGYHLACYNRRCIYCEEYYKNGIDKNVNAFLKRIEKGADILTREDLDDDNTSVAEEDDEPEESEGDQMDVSSRLVAAIEDVENW